MELSARRGLTIVSADSRQIYRGFDVGTAKPGADDRRRVPHLGLDIAEPNDRWSAARWASDAAHWIASATPERSLVVGGTGLYLKALTSPFFDEPPLDEVRRARLAEEIGGWPDATLRRWATELDPPRARLGRAQLLRVIEVALLTGRRLSDLHRESERAPRYRAKWLVVDPGPALAAQLESRLDVMLEGGWVAEVERLMRSVPDGAPAWQACGYGAIRDMVHGGKSITSARTTILVHTRQYAKRQRTWFRHQLPDRGVTRIDPRAAGALDAALAWWDAEDSE